MQTDTHKHKHTHTHKHTRTHKHTHTHTRARARTHRESKMSTLLDRKYNDVDADVSVINMKEDSVIDTFVVIVFIMVTRSPNFGGKMAPTFFH